jgi:hypothetical protein
MSVCGTHLVEASNRIPDALGQFSVLQQTVCSRSVKRAHSHIHARKGKDTAQSFCPEVFGGAAIDALKGMEFKDVGKETKTQHGGDAGKVAREHMVDTELVVVVGLSKEVEVSRVSVLAFPFLDLRLHQGQIGRELELLAVSEPHVVVWLAFDYVHSFGFQGGIEVGKGLVKEARQEQQGWALVESLSGCCQLSVGECLLYGDIHTQPSWCINEQRPPVKSFFSKTVTLNPALARRAAVDTPPAPAPIVGR